MPNTVVKSYAKQSGKSVAVVEEMWNEIKKYVNKKYPKLAKARKFAYIVSVLGKKLGIKKTEKVKESTNTLSLVGLLNEAANESMPNIEELDEYPEDGNNDLSIAIKANDYEKCIDILDKMEEMDEEVSTYMIFDAIKSKNEDIVELFLSRGVGYEGPISKEELDDLDTTDEIRERVLKIIGVEDDEDEDE